MTQSATGWRPLGAVLVESGAITKDELDAALAEQRVSGKRLGEILIDCGAITWLTLARAIAEQEPDVAEARGAPTVEAMLHERRRAFLELVSATETLRRTVARLKDDVAARDTEIARLRAAQPQSG